MASRSGAPSSGTVAVFILDYRAPLGTLRPVVLRHFVWYFLALSSVLFFSTAAAVAAISAS